MKEAGRFDDWHKKEVSPMVFSSGHFTISSFEVFFGWLTDLICRPDS